MKKGLVFKLLVTAIVFGVPLIHVLAVQAQACAVMLGETQLPTAFRE